MIIRHAVCMTVLNEICLAKRETSYTFLNLKNIIFI